MNTGSNLLLKVVSGTDRAQSTRGTAGRIAGQHSTRRLVSGNFSPMSRTIQGVIFGAVLVATVAAVLLLANVGADKEVCRLAFSVNTVGCFLRNYKELAAGLLGAAGALLAAWIAWLAVQRQIRHAEELATAREKEALEVIRVELKHIVMIINVLWRAVDFALKPGQEPTIRQRRESLVRRAFDLPSPRDNIAVIKELSQYVGPLPRRILALIVHEIEAFYDGLSRQRIENAEPNFDTTLRWVRRFCTRVEMLISLIDRQLVRVLEQRTRDEIPYGDESPEFVALAEATWIMEEIDEAEAREC